VAVNPDYVRHGGWTHAAGRMQAEALLDLPVPPTAMFCYCDRMALGVYDAVKARGLSIPEDISVVGYDDEAFAADMAPPLTTVVLPHEAMGRWAATTLLDGGAELLSNRKHRRTKIACDLVVRGSIAPPR
jgi:LacI family transcriptional regulator